MSKTIHALIVGINAYSTKPLFGCVNDALAVGRFFKDFCDDAAHQHRWNPRYLLAPHATDKTALEQAAQADPMVAQSQLPLRQNLIDAFEHFYSDAVKPDDICLVYYSGHGALEPVAPELAHLEPDGMCETFVCLDSRDAGQRDLLDKEMAWLLHKAKKRIPEGHLLVITDSCHSGGATKSSDNTTRDRRESATETPTPFEQMLGVLNVPESERIFKVTDKKADYRSEAAHVQLAASRDSETAKETYINGQQHGVFTWNLLRVLSSGGTALSYRELMRRTEVMVRNSTPNQMPQLNAFAGAQRLDTFLGGALSGATTEYPVVCQKGQWHLKAGTLNGIVVDPEKKQPTIVRLTDGREVAVTEVFSNYALLDGTKFTAAEAGALMFEQRATITQMPNAKVSVFIREASIKPEALAKLQETIGNVRPMYADFNAVSEAGADYYVDTDDAGLYLLVRKGSNYPVFKRQANPFDFVDYCNSVGRWRFVQEMGKSSMAGFSMDDLEINVEVLSDIDPATINTAPGQSVPLDNVQLTYTPPDEQGAGEKVPALRCSVRMKQPNFWVGGLYLDNEYGIHPFLDVRQDTKGAPLEFTFQDENQSYNAIPLVIDAIRLKQGVREITEYLKIYISNKDFSLADFEQNALPLDDQPLTKGVGFPKGFSTAPDWMVITIPVTIKAASVAMPLRSLAGAGFRISELPEGFDAKVALASESDITEKLERSRSLEVVEMDFRKFVLPPAGLWGESMEESVVFATSLDGRQSQSVTVMELTEVSQPLKAPFYLDLDNPCSDDEVIVAYGYDEDADSYFPVGLSTGNNQVEVMAMPSATPGRIQGEEAGFVGKDAGGSVKMFFKKLIKKQNPNTLALVNKDLSRVTDLTKIREATAAAKNILMVTHGYLGDTEKIVAAMMQKTHIHESYEVVLAYDFENLNTPLDVTAKDMYQRLQDAGVFDPAKGRRLTILGSSTGGVVCRWMLEKDKNGVDMVRKLFLVAAPNLGTDLSVFRKRLFGLIGKALSGVAAIKPYLIPLSILGKKAGKELWVTLNQLDPSSDFIRDLNHQAQLPTEIERSSIGGTVKNLGLNKNNSGNFWKRLKKFVLKTFLDWAVFEGEHDMINPLKSQKGAPWFKPGDIVIMDVDHLSYYFEEVSLKEMEKALKVYTGA